MCVYRNIPDISGIVLYEIILNCNFNGTQKNLVLSVLSVYSRHCIILPQPSENQAVTPPLTLLLCLPWMLLNHFSPQLTFTEIDMSQRKEEKKKKSRAHKKAQRSFGKPKHSPVVDLISQDSNVWFCAQHQWFDRFCSPLEGPQRAKSRVIDYAGHSYAAAA